MSYLQDMHFKNFLNQRATSEGLPFKTVLKEAIQIVFLEELYKLPESEEIVFQGGTCIRLAYGGPRYSDDLDFVTLLDNKVLRKLYDKISTRIAKLGPLFSGKFETRIQKEATDLIRWKLYYFSLDNKENTSVNIEFAKFPAYQVQLVPLNLPQGFPSAEFILLKAETPEELLCDKLVAFFGRKYLKGRDIFDLWYLKTKNARFNKNLLQKKFRDYSVSKERTTLSSLNLTKETLRNDLKNFLPKHYRDKFEKENYKLLIDSAKAVLRQTLR